MQKYAASAKLEALSRKVPRGGPWPVLMSSCDECPVWAASVGTIANARSLLYGRFEPFADLGIAALQLSSYDPTKSRAVLRSQKGMHCRFQQRAEALRRKHFRS